MFQLISDNIVFGALRFIKHGEIELTNFDGKKYFFGEKKKKFKCEIKN